VEIVSSGFKDLRQSYYILREDEDEESEFPESGFGEVGEVAVFSASPLVIWLCSFG
jgi:hypothetical protein